MIKNKFPLQYLLLPILLVSIIASCEDDPVEPFDEERFSMFPVVYTISSQQEDTVLVTAVNTCGSDCWTDIRNEVTQDGFTFRLSATYRQEGICNAACITVARRFEIVLPERGEYTLDYIHADTVAKSLTVTY